MKAFGTGVLRGLDPTGKIIKSDRAASSQTAQRLGRLAVTKECVQNAMQNAYASHGADSSNNLAQAYFLAGVDKSGEQWKVINFEALTKAFQWDAVAKQYHHQITLPIMERYSPNGSPRKADEERNAILATLSAEERSKIEQTQQEWLEQFPKQDEK